MAWFLGSRRGPGWKHGWSHQTLTSISLPPFPLLAIFAIIVFLLSFSRYIEYKTNFHQTLINFQFVLFLTPLLMILVIWTMSSAGKLLFRQPHSAPPETAQRAGGGSPWGVALLLVVLLVMISYQSSFQSQWFRPLWRGD